MNKIKVSKAKLLADIKANLAEHVRELKEVSKEYRRQLTVILKDMVDKVDLEKDVDTYIRLEKPKSYEAQYLTAIKAIEYSDAEFFELSLKEFQQYVLDNWEWKETWSLSNSSYK